MTEPPYLLRSAIDRRYLIFEVARHPVFAIDLRLCFDPCVPLQLFYYGSTTMRILGLALGGHIHGAG
jgi:hypothetical protein